MPATIKAPAEQLSFTGSCTSIAPGGQTLASRNSGKDRDRIRHVAEQRVRDDEVVGAVLGAQVRSAANLERDLAL